MSLLLSLLRSPRILTSQNRRGNEPKEVCTEMGVFNRRGTELAQLSSSHPPYEPSTKEVPSNKLSSPSNSELQDEDRCSGFTDIPCDSAPTEVTFAWEILSGGASAGANIFVQEALERLCWSGAVLCKLLSSALPGSLDERAVNDESDGGCDLTASDAFENFQLCLSCAQAQGCDVQGFAVEQLQKASHLTDFVLEILRVTAVQAIPAVDRQFVSPAPQAPRALATLAAPMFPLPRTASFPAGGRAALPPAAQGPHVGQAQGAYKSVCATTDEGAEPAGHGTATLHGTAAARRSAACLERWVLQVVGARSAEPGTSLSPSASLRLPSSEFPASPVVSISTSPAVLPPAPSQALRFSPGMLPHRGAAAGPLRCSLTATSSAPQGNDRPPKEGNQKPDDYVAAAVGSGSGGAVTAAAGPGVAAAAVPDWNETDALASELQSQRQGSEPVGGRASFGRGSNGESAREVDPLGLEEWEALATLCKGTAPASPGSPQAAMGLQVRVPCAGADEEEQARWDAAATALSSTFTAAPIHGSPLPPLRAEHLRCRHPGLRSLLLARALLAYCRQRDGWPAAPSLAPVDTARVKSGADSSSSSERPAGSGTVSPASPSGRGGSGGAEYGYGAAATAVAAAAAAAAKMLPASPAPPLPPLQQPSPVSGVLSRRHTSTGGRQPMDLLSEHNLLVQQEHQQRELRRQQHQQQFEEQPRSVGGGGAGPGSGEERSGVIWSGDGDDEEGEDQEERVLRLWLNSLGPGLHVISLFEQEVATGWPLLLALEAIQPGCVPWTDTFRPPFKEKLRKILSVQNCNLVIEVCTRQLAMPPLVNIGGLDLALGHRRATLSLVFQMMRHHMGMLLGLAAPHAPPATPPHSTTTIATAPPTTPHQHHQPAHHGLGHSYSFGHGYGHGYGPDVSPHGAQAQHLPHAPSPQRGTRAHVEVEKAVLAWANAKLTEAAVAAAEAAAGAAAATTAANSGAEVAAGAAASTVASAGGGGVAPQLPFTPLASFSDKRLGEGRVLLQLLAAICPRSVNAKYVLPGRDEEERGSNARYLLSCARKLGCVIFLAWEDVLAARPNLLLLLLASFMALDRKRAGAAARANAGAGVGADAGTTPPATLAAAVADAASTAAAVLGAAAAVGPRLSAAQAPAAPPR